MFYFTCALEYLKKASDNAAELTQVYTLTNTL